MLGVGRDLCGSSRPTPLPKQGHLQQAAQDLVQVGLECLQRGRLHNLPGQPVLVLHHPQREEVLPYVKWGKNVKWQSNSKWLAEIKKWNINQNVKDIMKQKVSYGYHSLSMFTETNFGSPPIETKLPIHPEEQRRELLFQVLSTPLEHFYQIFSILWNNFIQRSADSISILYQPIYSFTTSKS